MVRDLIAAFLRSAGYDVRTSVDGEEGFALFRRSWRDIDLVVLDLAMPKMGGRDTFLAMRDIHPDVRVLLVSGYSMEGEAQELLSAGAMGFLQKPFKRAQLLDLVADALVRH